jgi:acetyltransferase
MNELDIDVAELSEATNIRLGRIFPESMPVANPVDIWPAIEQHSGTGLDIYSLAMEAALDDPGVDAVLVHAFSGYTRIRWDFDKISRQSGSSGSPF